MADESQQRDVVGLAMILGLQDVSSRSQARFGGPLKGAQPRGSTSASRSAEGKHEREGSGCAPAGPPGSPSSRASGDAAPVAGAMRVADSSATASDPSADVRIPADAAPYLRDLYRTSLLDAEEEFRLFSRLRTLRRQADRRAVDERVGARRQLDQVEAEMIRVRNRIVEANLRLVVSIARQFTGPGQPDLFDLISEGNSILLRAVDRFDVNYGTRFSTYATTAIRRRFLRIRETEYRQKKRFATGSDDALREFGGNTGQGAAACGSSAAQYEAARLLLAQLNHRERLIVESRFGFRAGRRQRTFRELAEQLGVSKERVRQLLRRAMYKLRAAAKRHRIESPDSQDLALR